MKDRPEFNPDNKDDDKLYSTKEVAETFSVTLETVRDWVKRGKIKGVKLPTGQFRIPRSELIRFGTSRYGQ